jgi:hypothetical protein
MTKHLSKDWMIENKFIPVTEYDNEENYFNKFNLDDLKLKPL